MRKLISILIVFALAPATWAHNTDPAQGGAMTVSYFNTPGPGKISVTHFPDESCVVNAQAVEIVIGTPLLNIQSVTQQPALEVFLSVAAIRRPANGSETTAVHLTWAATGSPDPLECQGSGDVFFNVTVIDGSQVVPTPPPTPPGANDSSEGEPVSTATGSLYEFFEDFYLRGPLPLVFDRYYSSSLAADGGASNTLGANWMHSFDLRLAMAGSTAKVIYYQGQNIVFTQWEGGLWQLTSASPFGYQLVSSGSLFRFLDPTSRYIYTFNPGAGGRLDRIEDRNGNALTLTYSGNLLSHVEDGLGATLDFSYTVGGKLANVRDQSGRIVSFTYDAGNNLVSSTDPRGGVTLYAYTVGGGNSGLLLSATMPRGNVHFSQTYDANGRVATQTDASGNTTSFAYSVPAQGQTTVTDALGAVSVFRYQGVNLVGESGPYPNSSTRTYDANNRIILQQDNAGNRFSFTYHAASGLVGSVTAPDGKTGTFTYSPTISGGFTLFDVTSLTFPDGASESYAYDAKGNMTSRTDRAGQVWQATYNSRGQILSLRLPTGAIQTYTYNADGTRASISVPGAGTISFTYDVLKRITQRTRTGGVTRNFAYDATDGLTLYTDANGAVTQYVRDQNGFTRILTNALGGATTNTRDGNEHITGMTDPPDQPVQIGYDKLQRPSSIRLQDASIFAFGYDAAGNRASLTDGEGKVWHRGFDQNGRPVSLTTPLGNTTTLTRDSVGRITAMVDSLGNRFEFSYDAAGRATSVLDPLDGTTQVSYDARGLITGVTLPQNVSASYSRDALGNIAQIQDPNGNRWLSSYDGAGRLISLTDPLGNAQSFTRNDRGWIASVTTPQGTANITTDAAGHLTQASYSDGTSLTFAYNAAGQTTTASGAAFEYDNRGLMMRSNGMDVQRDSLGRISQVTLAAGRTVQYTYDRRNLVVQVRDWLGGTTAFSYDNDGRLVTITRPNGIVTSYGYDAEGQVNSIAENAGSNSLLSIALTRDKLGRTVQATRNVPLTPTPAQVSALSRSRSYDSLSQIVGFSYDRLGRRLQDDRRAYSWDLASRLTSYTAGAQSSQLAYNALGHLVSETRTGGSARQYVWNYAFDLPSISVVRQNNNDLRYYVHTPAGELLYSIDADGTRRYYHFDEMGNTLFLTGAAGTVTDSYAYTPYGELLVSTGSSDNSFTYAGRYGALALGSDLYSMRLRVYDSVTGSFLSRDPITQLDPRLVNPYQYAAGNPLAYVDKTGADPSATGTTAGDVASTGVTLAGNATSVTGPMVQNIEKVIDSVPLLVNQAKTVEETPQDINAAFKVFKLKESVPQLEAKASKLKTVGKAGAALQLVNVGIQGVKLNDGINNAMSDFDKNANGAEETFNNTMTTLRDLYLKKKISLVDYRRQRLQALHNVEDAQMATADNLFTDLELNGFEFVKDSLTGLTPVPGAVWDGLTSFGSWVIK